MPMSLDLMGLGLTRSGVAGAAGAPVYDTDALAIFAAFTTPPDTARKALINAVVVGLKSDGSWTSISCLPVFAAADSQAALIDWRLPSRVFTAVNTPTFTADRGFAGDAATSYIDTTVLASGLAATQHSFGDYLNVSASNSYSMGANAATLRHAIGQTTTKIVARDGSTTGQTGAVAVGARTGLTSTSREGSATDYLAYYNGAFVETMVSGASGASSGTICFGLAGSATFSADRHAAGFVCLTAGLTAAQMTNTYNRLLTYLTAIGAQ